MEPLSVLWLLYCFVVVWASDSTRSEIHCNKAVAPRRQHIMISYDNTVLFINGL